MASGAWRAGGLAGDMKDAADIVCRRRGWMRGKRTPTVDGCRAASIAWDVRGFRGGGRTRPIVSSRCVHERRGGLGKSGNGRLTVGVVGDHGDVG